MRLLVQWWVLRQTIIIVSWIYPGNGFTKDFDLTVGWLAVYLPRSTVSKYMRIDWETVDCCVHRILNEIEPERSR